jgi:tetratricopeptide (TPR) repeat protein
MTGIFRKFFIYLLCVFLFSCAGGDLKQDADTGVMNKKLIHVDVDSDVESDFKSAIALLQQEQYTQAIVVLKSVIEREQRLPAPYVNIAIAYNRLGETKDAELNLISALKLDIAHPIANNELGLLYRKTGKFNAARTAYENAIKEHPDYLPAKRNLGVLCDLYMHDFECALEQFEDYLELNPDDKDAVIWVADVKRRLGQ